MINNHDDCLESILEKNFFIKDDEPTQPAFVNYENGQFEVINKTNDDIIFFKIDNCVVFDDDCKKCDCAVFNEKEFCFIEVKTLVSDKSTIKTKRRKTAENQLKYTIENFKDDELLKNKNLEAYVSLSCNKDDKLTQIPNIGNQNTILEFEDELDASLYYSCKKEFK